MIILNEKRNNNGRLTFFYIRFIHSFTVCVCKFYLCDNNKNIKATLKWFRCCWYEINYYRVVMAFVVAVTPMVLAAFYFWIFSISACLFSFFFLQAINRSTTGIIKMYNRYIKKHPTITLTAVAAATTILIIIF